MNVAAAWAPWFGIGAIGVVVLLLSGVLRLLQRSTDVAPETVRKLFHLGGGAIALALPWLFDALWPVLVTTAASMVVFIVLRIVPSLRANQGQVLLAVPRETVGEFWFLLGVLVVYVIAGDDVVVYSIGILILAVADTAAALVGVFYGRHTFEVSGSTKSAEGSTAFLLTAFLCVHVPLLLFTDIGRLESLLIGLNVGLLMMLVEADAARGSDNFVLPVLVVVMLEVYFDMNAPGLAVHLGIIGALCLFVFFYRDRTTLSEDALIGAALAGYVFWLFGDWRWLVGPVLIFATYTWLVGRPRLASSRPFHADVLLAIVAPGLVLVTAYEVLKLELLYLPYVAVWCANLAVIGTLHEKLETPGHPSWRSAGANTLKSLVIMIPGLAAGGIYPPWGLAATLVCVPAAVAMFGFIGKPLMADPLRSDGWWSVTTSVSAGVLLSFGVLAAVGALRS